MRLTVKSNHKIYFNQISVSVGLNEEQKQIRDVAIDFANIELKPFMKEWDEKAIFPIETFKKAASLGFAGIYVRPESGGSGMGRLEASLIFEALSQGCVSSAAYISIHK